MEWGRTLASGLIFACAACSSGGGGGGGSAADAVTAKAQGAITVIGSAAVTGTVWDTDGAEVFFGDEDDGEQGAKDGDGELELGQVGNVVVAD